MLITVVGALCGFVWNASAEVDDMRHLQQTVLELQNAVQNGRSEDRRATTEQIADLKAQLDARARSDEAERQRIADLLTDMTGKQIRIDAQLGFLSTLKERR